MLNNNIIVIIVMSQYISIKFFNTCYLDQHKIAGYKSKCQCGRFCHRMMMWVRYLKMHISNIYVYVYMRVCVPYHSKKSKGVYQKHFTNSSSIYYEFSLLRPSNI